MKGRTNGSILDIKMGTSSITFNTKTKSVDVVEKKDE